jgi:tail assembly chaperone
MEALVCNVEEYIAKRLYDAGEPGAARKAIERAASLPNDLPFDQLQAVRLVPLDAAEVADRKAQAAADRWMLLRSDRDAALAASDWTQLPDVPAATAKAWAAYRQTLRDLPANTDDPAAPPWPKPPA